MAFLGLPECFALCHPRCGVNLSVFQGMFHKREHFGEGSLIWALCMLNQSIEQQTVHREGGDKGHSRMKLSGSG